MKQITCPHCADTYPDFDVAHVCSKGPYAPKLKSKMNERIRELAVQATTYIEPTSNSGEGWIFDKEKFAELIVRECMRMCDCADVSLLEHNYPKEASGASSVKQFIAEHFGVEE